MRPLSCLVTAITIASTLAACGSKSDAPAPADKPATGSGASAVPGAPAQRAYVLEIFVNDASAAKVTAAQIAAWPRLDSLLPPEDRKLGQWTAITTTTLDGKSNELAKPFDTYPDMVPAVFPATGGVGFGMFDAVELAKQGSAGMHQDQIKSIKITLATGGSHGGNDDNDEVGDPTKLVLTFKTASGETTFPGDKLLAIPRETMPGGQGESKGWKLAALLDAAGVKTYDKLLLTDDRGTNLTLEKADFADGQSVPFVKLNKKGKLRVTVYKKQGDGWTPGADLRALQRIEVTK